MPKSLTQYRVFIGSPGGLGEERRRFHNTLERYTANHSEPRGVTFHPVGWEDTLAGAGRPQKLINEDLAQCDYAVFVLHDRWGSPPGSKYSSGTEEEWELAEKLYAEAKIRNIALFFKQVDRRHLSDPGEQLKKVMKFKEQIEEDKKYLFKSYSKISGCCEELEKHLAKWLRDHEGGAKGSALDNLAGVSPSAAKADLTPATAPPPATPGFEYWMAEAGRLLEAGAVENRNYPEVLFCSERATATAGSDIDRARAKLLLGTAQFFLNKLTECLTIFTEVAEVFDDGEEKNRVSLARALLSKGVTLSRLDRNEDAIATYDEVIARFGTGSELALREQVAKALLNKGVGLSKLDRSEDEIAVYDDLIARFGTAPELGVREQVANALLYKGITLGQLNRNKAAIAVYNEVITRFAAADQPTLKEIVSRAKSLRKQKK